MYIIYIYIYTHTLYIYTLYICIYIYIWYMCIMSIPRYCCDLRHWTCKTLDISKSWPKGIHTCLFLNKTAELQRIGAIYGLLPPNHPELVSRKIYRESLNMSMVSCRLFPYTYPWNRSFPELKLPPVQHGKVLAAKLEQKIAQCNHV